VKILIASVISEAAVDELRKRYDVVDAVGVPEEDLKRLIADRDAVILRSGVELTADVLRCAPGLGLIVRAGSGFDNIDVAYAEQNGIELVRVPGPGAQAVAEMAFALMLALARQLFKADALWRAGHWAKYEVKGRMLSGKTLGIYGAGNIGGKTARMGAAWGMRVVACVEGPTDEIAAEFAAQGIELAPADTVLAEADFLAIHVPLNDTTRGLIGADELARMKPGAFLVNLARGGVVDEAALLDALTSGHLAGAGVDVHEREGEGEISPLAGLPNVVLTPHIGASTVDAQEIIGRTVLDIFAERS
jgi:phosphoglycerate dehydrogenase-like enzyme